MAKNVPLGSEILFGDDLNKRITQINNTNNALLTKPSLTVSYKPSPNQTGWYSNGKNTTYQHQQNSNQYPKNLHPSWKSSTTGRRGTDRATTASIGTEKSKYVKFQSWKFKKSLLGLKKITSERIILDIIKNDLKSDFMERENITCSPKIPHSELEKRMINAEIEKLLQKGVIIKCDTMILYLLYLLEKRKMVHLEPY